MKYDLIVVGMGPSAAFLAYELIQLGIAKDKTTTRVALSGAAGAIAGGFVNLYPPGIPVFAPGEVLEEAGLAAVARAMEAGFAVDGIEEQTIEILDE